MSRTIYVDLKTARRSRRLQEKGYYLQPVGLQVQAEDISSEDDDDIVIEPLHSNNSSIYSKRTVHYGGTYSSPSSLKKRKPRGIGRSRQGGILVKDDSFSPVKSSRRLQLETTDVGSSKSTPNLLVSRISEREKVSTSIANQTVAAKETKTTITTFRQADQRHAQGESSTVSRSRTVSQNQSHIAAAEHAATMTRNRTHFDGIGGGDQMRTPTYADATELNSQMHWPSGRANGDAGQIGLSNRMAHQRRSLYSSESEDEKVAPGKQHGSGETPLDVLVTKMSLAAWISACVGYISGEIYKVTLTVFDFDVRWLSLRTNPLFAKVARFLLLLFFALLLLATAYLVATQLVDDPRHVAMLPVQSVAVLFQMLSQKIRAFAVLSGGGRDRLVTERLLETDSEYTGSNRDFEAILIKTELHFAEKLAEIKRDMTKLKQDQKDFNMKQAKMAESQDQALQKLAALKNEVETNDLSRTKSGDAIKAEIEDLRTLLADKSHATVKINEFSGKMTAFDARLNSMNDLVINSVKTFDLHIGNTSYIKEIAKMQFIESFLNVIKTTQGSAEEKNQLHFLLVAWLNKQGFAKIDEVDGDIKRLEENHDHALAALEKKFVTQFERVRHEARQQSSSSITLERIVERPLKQDVINVGMEANVRKWVQDELAIYSADRIALADHALESAGGFIVNTRCSESYNRKTALVSLFGIPIYYNMNTPRSVIQPSNLPGECWSFKGSEGYLVIAISGAVRPTSFTLEHIPRELSPHGRIDSAPKEFKVLGLNDAQDYEGLSLGEYRYEQDGPVIQQFTVTVDNSKYFSHIELRVASNWGHPDYTCLYRFRVHGDRQAVEIPPS